MVVTFTFLALIYLFHVHELYLSFFYNFDKVYHRYYCFVQERIPDFFLVYVSVTLAYQFRQEGQKSKLIS
jgi:hypothetical protein